MPSKIITDLKHLSLFKKRQLRQQLPSLALLALSFLAGFALPFYGHYPELVVAVLAISWYLYIGACYRFKERITVPDGDLLLCPITGRVRYLKTSSDITQLKISKSPIDLIEVRCPHSTCVWDAETLKVNFRGQSLIFRFEAEQLIRFEDAPMQAGNTIGYIVGGASCYISIPKPLQTVVKPKELCLAGLSAIIAD